MSTAPITSVTPDIQYQVSEPRAAQPNTTSRGTGMPSGPPVQRASLVNTIGDEQAHAKRGDREIMALESQDRPADDEGDEAGKRRRRRAGSPRSGMPRCVGPMATA